MIENDIKTKYYPGKLVVLTNELFSKQKNLSEVKQNNFRKIILLIGNHWLKDTSVLIAFIVL